MNRIKRSVSLILFAICLVIYGATNEAYALSIDQRLAGTDRYGTAVEISKYGWQQTSDNAILATGEDFPDALCAAPLAKALNAPILLTGKAVLDPGVDSELKRMSVKNVIIIGGYGVISKTVEDSLKNKGIAVTRLYGSDRYGTSLAIANYSGVSFSKEVFVTTGDNFPDALSIAVIAAKRGMPIILSPKIVLPTDTAKYIKDKGVTKAYIIGGAGVISEGVKQQFPNSERIVGIDRYETNRAVINKFAGEINFSVTYIATGEDYPDALAGSALASRTSSPIILVDKTSQSSVRDFIVSNYTSISQAKVLGGVGVVTPSILEEIIPKVVVFSINNINDTVSQGRNYVLPQKIIANTSNSAADEVAVTWSPGTADTSKPGVYTFNGTVEGYKKPVELTLTVNELHSITGNADITAEKLAKFLMDNYPKDKQIKLAEGLTPSALAQMFLEEGKIEGVRGDIAFCQSIHETGWFTYGGQVLPEQNNYAGIGATNNSPVGKGAWFSTPREGVRAQIQHLKAYASKEPLKQPTVDPRYDILVKNNLLGVAPNWEDLNGRWAVPGTTYGQSIIELYKMAKASN